MTVAKAIAQWMEDNNFGVLGTNLFIGSVPKDAPKASWWIVGGGGTPVVKAQTGERIKEYIFNVFYRNIDAEDVDEKLQALEIFANSKVCHTLPTYETVELEAIGFQSDNDLDLEDRSVGTVQLKATIYQSE